MRLFISGRKSLRGICSVPPDKSLSHRALIFGSFAHGQTQIQNLLDADDVMSTVRCLRSLGVKIESRGNGEWVVDGVSGGRLTRPDLPLDCGNSGTTIRLLMGLLSAHPFESILTGDGSLRQRPMDRVAIPLMRMGAHIEGRTERYLPPVIVRGGFLRPIAWELPVASAQAKTALLIAGCFAKGATTVVEPVKTRDHSERLLRYMGAHLVSKGRAVTVIGPTTLRGVPIQISGDPSSAAFLFAGAAGSPDGELTVTDLCVNPTRTEYLSLLHKMGAQVDIRDLKEVSGEPVACVSVRGARLRAVSPEWWQIPSLIDELPIIAVLASIAEGETRITGAQELRVKESDRIRSMAVELRKMGADIDERQDGWQIRGPAPLKGATVRSWGDHRVAMALAIAAIYADGVTVIEDAQCIAISFPQFPQLLAQLGGEIRVE